MELNLRKKIISSVQTLCFLIIIMMSLYLRLWHVGNNPAWYTDEATHIEIAQNLRHAEIRYFAIQDSWLLFARLPLFELILATVFWLFDVGIAVLRGLTGVLGVITTILLYIVLRDCTKGIFQYMNRNDLLHAAKGHFR